MFDSVIDELSLTTILAINNEIDMALGCAAFEAQYVLIENAVNFLANDNHFRFREEWLQKNWKSLKSVWTAASEHLDSNSADKQAGLCSQIEVCCIWQVFACWSQQVCGDSSTIVSELVRKSLLLSRSSFFRKQICLI